MFGEAHLRRILKAYAAYYDEIRTDLSLDKTLQLSAITDSRCDRTDAILGGLIINTFGYSFYYGQWSALTIDRLTFCSVMI